MCKHILNAQVSVRAPCCRKFYDCPQCHAEHSDHELMRTTEMSFVCKKCKKAFRKDLGVYEDSDEYCPHCDNHYVIDAKTPAPVLGIEGEDARIDNRMLKDDRMRYDPRRDFHGREADAYATERVDRGDPMEAAREARQRAMMPVDANGAPLLELGDDDLDWS